MNGDARATAIAETKRTDEFRKIDELNARAFEIRNVEPATSAEKAGEALGLSAAANYTKGRAEALLHLGFHHMHVAKHEIAFQQLIESLSLFTELGNESGIASAQYNLGILYV